MAASATIGQSGEISIGAAFGKGFDLLGRRTAEILIASLALGALPWVALEVLSQHFMAQFTLGAWQMGALALTAGVVVGVIGMTAALALVARIAIMAADHRDEPVATSLDVTLRRYPALLVMALIRDLATWIGMVLLIIPGLIASLVWAVATPAMVAEGLGPIEALRRSADLTRGLRWRILGLAVVVGIAEMVGNYLIERVAGSFYGGRVALDQAIAHDWPIGYMVAMAIYHTASIAITGSIFAALYVQLRDGKDGPQTDTLAEVFA